MHFTLFVVLLSLLQFSFQLSTSEEPSDIFKVYRFLYRFHVRIVSMQFVKPSKCSIFCSKFDPYQYIWCIVYFYECFVMVHCDLCAIIVSWVYFSIFLHFFQNGNAVWKKNKVYQKWDVVCFNWLTHACSTTQRFSDPSVTAEIPLLYIFSSSHNWKWLIIEGYQNKVALGCRNDPNMQPAGGALA